MKALFVGLFLLAPFAQAADAPRALYEVPVPQEMKAFSKYEISYFGKKVSGDTLELTYQLPLELTGISQWVSFSGKIIHGKEPATLSGPNGEMNCASNTEALRGDTCAVKYHDIKVDLNAVAQRLKIARISPEMREGKLRIAAMFRESGGDIGGIITYLGVSSEVETDDAN
ncbi:MAG: hypothetical protein ACXWQO_05850 [Bdellovibrionota bacterium]